jgi:hypothetical protein
LQFAPSLVVPGFADVERQIWAGLVLISISFLRRQLLAFGPVAVIFWTAAIWLAGAADILRDATRMETHLCRDHEGVRL